MSEGSLAPVLYYFFVRGEMVCGLDIVWGTRGDRAGIKSTKGKQKGKGGRQTPCSATHTSYGKPVWSLVFIIDDKSRE